MFDEGLMESDVKRGDTAVCSCFTAELPIQQSSKALKHVLQAHLNNTFFPTPIHHTHTHKVKERH